MCMLMDTREREADRQTDRDRDRQTDRQSAKQKEYVCFDDYGNGWMGQREDYTDE